MVKMVFVINLRNFSRFFKNIFMTVDLRISESSLSVRKSLMIWKNVWINKEMVRKKDTLFSTNKLKEEFLNLIFDKIYLLKFLQLLTLSLIVVSLFIYCITIVEVSVNKWLVGSNKNWLVQKMLKLFLIELRLPDRSLIWIRKKIGPKIELCEHQDGIMHLVWTQTYPKDCHSVPPDTHICLQTYISVRIRR